MGQFGVIILGKDIEQVRSELQDREDILSIEKRAIPTVRRGIRVREEGVEVAFFEPSLQILVETAENKKADPRLTASSLIEKIMILAYERYTSLPDNHPIKAKYTPTLINDAYDTLFAERTP